jgi:hypothetical protein
VAESGLAVAKRQSKPLNGTINFEREKKKIHDRVALPQQVRRKPKLPLV